MILTRAEKKVWQVRTLKKKLKARAGGHFLHIYIEAFYTRVFVEKTKPLANRFYVSEYHFEF